MGGGEKEERRRRGREEGGGGEKEKKRKKVGKPGQYRQDKTNQNSEEREAEGGR